MKCQILFSGKNNKNITKYRLQIFLPTVQSMDVFLALWSPVVQLPTLRFYVVLMCHVFMWLPVVFMCHVFIWLPVVFMRHVFLVSK